MDNKKALIQSAIALLVWVAGPSATAQSVKPTATHTLDFIVTTRDAGLPPLAPDDISLKIGGRQQRIESVKSISGHALTRYVALVVDEATLHRSEPVVKEAIDKLLASLAPGDMAGFYSTRAGGTRLGLTPHRNRITEAVAAMKTGPGDLWTCMTDLMRVIELVAGDLPRGRATSIAVISRGHPEAPTTDSDPGAAP